MRPRFKATNIDCNFEYTYKRERIRPLGADLVLRKTRTVR